MTQSIASDLSSWQASPSARRASSAVEYRILIVDQDASIRRRYAEALIAVPPAMGVAYRIITVGSTAAAQLQAARQRYHLIIATLPAANNSVQELVDGLRDLYRGDIRLLLLRNSNTSLTQFEWANALGARLAERTIADDVLRATVADLLGVRSAERAASPAPQPQERPLASQPQECPPTRVATTSADVQLLLDVLRHEACGQFALYADNIGHIIAQRGDDTGIDVPALTSLVAGSFVNALELGHVLRDPETIHLNIHEGTAYDVYSTNVGSNRLLVLLFDKQRSNPRLGFVWLLMKRSAQQLRRMASKESSTDQCLSQQISSSLNDEFDRLFGGELLQE